jgi:hypothetical protein
MQIPEHRTLNIERRTLNIERRTLNVDRMRRLEIGR